MQDRDPCQTVITQKPKVTAQPISLNISTPKGQARRTAAQPTSLQTYNP